MSGDRLRSVRVDQIHLRDDIVTRSVSEAAIADLVESIRVSGLQTAVRVRPVTIYKSSVPSSEWELIAGRHRVEAVRRLDWTEIPAIVEDISDNLAEIAMIDENVKRKNLEPAEFCYAMARRKVLYELEFPQTRNGGDRKSDRNNCELIAGNKPDRFTTKAAELSGKSERHIQEAARIGKELGKQAPKLVGTSLGSITELSALASIKDDALRTKLISRALAGEEVSAIKAKPKRAPNKTRTPRLSPDVAGDDGAAPPEVSRKEATLDLTSAEDQKALAAVGEAAADANFCQESNNAQDWAAKEESAEEEIFEEVDAPPWADDDAQADAIWNAWTNASPRAKENFMSRAGLVRD